ncbi:hypothetical protein Tco_1444020 [Tanacetum coccineum]
MALCTNLQKKVLDLEQTKTTQQIKIDSLKMRVKKLENKRSLKTHKLKKLYKVGLSAKVESSRDEDNDADNEMFDVGTLTGNEVSAEQEVAVKEVNLTVDEVTLAQALAALKSVKPKVKGDVIEEPSVLVSAASASTKVSAATTTTATILTPRKGIVITELAEFDEEERLAKEKDEANVVLTEEWDDIQAKNEADHELAQRLQAEEQEELSIEEKAKLFQQLLEQRRKHFDAKSAEEKRNKPPTQAQQIKIMVNTFVDFTADLVEGSLNRVGEELEQESTKKEKVDEDKDTTELQSLIEVIPDEEEVAIDVVPLATKSPSIIDWKIHKEGTKSYYQIVRGDGKSQMYRVFSQMLKSFTREDLEDLYKLVKAKYKSTRPVEDLDLVLWNDLKTMFEPHVEDEIWKLQQRYKVLSWKLFDSCRVHFLSLQSGMIYMLVEKRYPFTPPTITDMLNNKLQVDYFSKMTAGEVTTASTKLLLLEEVTTASTKVTTASEEVGTAELESIVSRLGLIGV